MGSGGQASNLNYNGSVNNMNAINLGGSIKVNGSIGNGDVTQEGNSSATGGTTNIGVTVAMPGLQELLIGPEWTWNSPVVPTIMLLQL